MTENPVLFTIGIPVEPVPKGRPKSGNGHFYTPPRTRDFEERVAWEMKAARIKRVDDDGLRLDVTFYLKDFRPTKRADFDNYVKSLCDAGNGVAWGDDRQIIESHIWLKHAKDCKPFITVSVRKSDYLIGEGDDAA